MFLRIFFLLFSAMSILSCTPKVTKIPLYIGTYTLPGESKGIYVYEFDTQSAQVSLKQEIETSNPSFLAKSDKFLLAVNETTNGEQSLSSFSLVSDQVNFINKLGTDGGAPCHVLLDGEGRYAVVSNYLGGALNLYALDGDGKILSKDDTKMYHGSSIDSSRQKESHIHSAFMGPDELIYVSDLGADQIYCLQVESNAGKLQFVTKDSIQTPLGGGPRHLAFHPTKEIFYALMEMTGDVVVYHKEANKWISKQVINMNADDFQGENGAADIKVSSDGKFVYATNRIDANSITCFEVKENGELAKTQVTSVIGKGPRSFSFSPDEKYILVANQLSDEVVIFGRDQETGLLEDTKKRIEAFKPVSVVF